MFEFSVIVVSLEFFKQLKLIFKATKMRKKAILDIFQVLFCTFCSVTNLTLTAGENA